ncbi:MAG: hypothetical protein QHH04_01800 [Methanolinea sp.]|nr:hypothetical protein [Methanolinea sp.]
MQSHKYFYFEADISVMDAATREQFKWKFYKLAIILNGVVLMAAIGVVVLFKAPGTISTPLAALFFILAAGLSFYFRRRYRSTREWLDEQS